MQRGQNTGSSETSTPISLTFRSLSSSSLAPGSSGCSLRKPVCHLNVVFTSHSLCYIVSKWDWRAKWDKKRGRVLTHKAHQLGLGHQVFALKPDGTAIIHRILLSTHYSLDVWQLMYDHQERQRWRERADKRLAVEGKSGHIYSGLYPMQKNGTNVRKGPKWT